MEQQSRKKVQKLSDLTNAYKKAGPYINFTYTLIASFAIFGLLGWWADSYFESQPVLFLIGLFLGMAVGFYNFFKGIAGLEKRKE